MIIIYCNILNILIVIFCVAVNSQYEEIYESSRSISLLHSSNQCAARCVIIAGFDLSSLFSRHSSINVSAGVLISDIKNITDHFCMLLPMPVRGLLRRRSCENTKVHPVQLL